MNDGFLFFASRSERILVDWFETTVFLSGKFFYRSW